jgi:hypothetical protein
MFTVNKNPTDGDLRKFGRAMLIGFGVLAVALWMIVWWRGGRADMFSWSGSALEVTAACLAALGVALCVVSLASTSAAKPIYIVWMSVSVRIGIVMSTILLTVLFAVLLPVFSLIVRLGDPLRKRLVAGGTYWEEYKGHDATIDRMRRPF